MKNLRSIKGISSLAVVNLFIATGILLVPISFGISHAAAEECVTVAPLTEPYVPTGQQSEINYLEINAADVTLDSAAKWPDFKCFYASSPSQILVAPVCEAFSGDARLSALPKEGSYAIRCRGGEYKEGWVPNFRDGKLVVQTPKPTVTPTPTPQPTTLPTPTPSPTKVVAGQNFELSANLQSLDGVASTIKVQADSGTLAGGTTIKIGQNEFTGFLQGLPSFKIQAFNSKNVEINKLTKPIQIIIENIGDGAIPSILGADNKWKPLTLNPDLNLPANTSSAYLISENNTFTILTKEMGVFGVKKEQASLQITTNTQQNIWPLKTQVQINSAGGSGTGALTFAVGNKQICQVTNQGFVTGLKSGDCKITVIKDGDVRFLASKIVTTVLKFGTSKVVKNSQNNSTQTVNSSLISISDSVLAVDPRIALTGKKVSSAIDSASAVRLKINQAIQLNLTKSQPSTTYLITLALSTGSSVALAPTVSGADQNLTLQILQFIKPGKYKLLIRKVGDNEVKLINIEVTS
jgi:hypothetical protein